MTPALTSAQQTELKNLLLARRQELVRQIDQNQTQLDPPEVNAGSVSQDENLRLSIQTREIGGTLTAIEREEITRIGRALESMLRGDYGICKTCGEPIAFARLKAEPMTEHCVACKSDWEKKHPAK
ncbi:MAG: TraR/DksA family transcriptional regulator [Burkholderiaceae bacterium]|jgi:DnaK suppressor protein|nr:TraR/DksA family transcriptional regulator [Burkholderiaceae bacterium]